MSREYKKKQAPKYRPEPKYRQEQHSHDGFKLHHSEGAWGFVEGQTPKQLIGRGESAAINACAKKRGLVKNVGWR